jgi:integrase/recombinase XerD
MDSKRILRDLETEIVSRNLSRQTLASYGSCLRMFCEYFKAKEHPTHINGRETKEFLAWVNQNHSVSQERSCFWAVRFLYLEIEHQPHKMDDIRPPKITKRLHIPLASDTVIESIGKIRDRKHKAIIELLFSTGLRLHEAATIKLADIDSRNMVIVVHYGKGNKDRIVQLHPILLETLRDYLRDLRGKNRMPKVYLFESETTPGNFISPSTIYRICKQYLGANTHKLRHAYATDFYRNTKDILALRDLLGHSNARTTEIYVHNDPAAIRNLYNPLSQMGRAA